MPSLIILCRTTGLSPDFAFINPLGFLALTLWNWGAYFSPVARREYQSRHDGHLPQVSAFDLAFSLHAIIVSLATLAQVFWYARNSTPKSHDRHSETSTLLRADRSAARLEDPTRPSVPCIVAIAGIFVASLVSAVFVWTDKSEWLDWLYAVSSIKLFISVVKFVPQVFLNWRLRSVEGFAIATILCVRPPKPLLFRREVLIGCVCRIWRDRSSPLLSWWCPRSSSSMIRRPSLRILQSWVWRVYLSRSTWCSWRRSIGSSGGD